MSEPMPSPMVEAALAAAGRVDPRGPMAAPAPGKDPVMVGALLTTVPGRTDQMEISVPADSYVLPADVVSALGEGNTLAGTRILDEMFGGAAESEPVGRAPVPIIAAGGEYVITPDQVAAVGRGDVEAGHDELDQFVKDVRNQLVKTLKKLPGPAR